MPFSTDRFTDKIPNIKKYCNLKKGGYLLEIGALEGKSAIEWVKNRDMKVTCVDPFILNPKWNFGTPEQVMDNFYINTKDYENNIELIKLKSFDYLISANYDKTKYDVVYVDGNHLSKFCLEDMVLSWKLLNKGGYMICDDYKRANDKNYKERERPSTAIDSFIKLYQDELDVVWKGNQVFLYKTK